MRPVLKFTIVVLAGAAAALPLSDTTKKLLKEAGAATFEDLRAASMANIDRMQQAARGSVHRVVSAFDRVTGAAASGWADIGKSAQGSDQHE
jgi:leucyl aminopeptidase (aminopeptidase T)